jgi:hypothetical protein
LEVQYKGRDAVYAWDPIQHKLIPTDFAPELQEANVRQAEQDLYFNQNPGRAVMILNGLLKAQIWENYVWSGGTLPRLRPYLLYLLGLAYERSDNPSGAVGAYWTLLHDYPASPYSLAAQSKLVKR